METQAKLEERYEAALAAGVKPDRVSKTADRLSPLNWPARCLWCQVHGRSGHPFPAPLVGFVLQKDSKMVFGRFRRETRRLGKEHSDPVPGLSFESGAETVTCPECKKPLDVLNPRIVGKTAWLLEVEE